MHRCKKHRQKFESFCSLFDLLSLSADYSEPNNVQPLLFSHIGIWKHWAEKSIAEAAKTNDDLFETSLRQRCGHSIINVYNEIDNILFYFCRVRVEYWCFALYLNQTFLGFKNCILKHFWTISKRLIKLDEPVYKIVGVLLHFGISSDRIDSSFTLVKRVYSTNDGIFNWSQWHWAILSHNPDRLVKNVGLFLFLLDW